MYKLLAYNFQGKPAINGHGAGMIGGDRLRIEKDLTLPDGIKLYEFEKGDRIDTYFDVTSIENYYNEAFGAIPDRDYLFIRDRILELVKQKAYEACIDTVSNPIGINPRPGSFYLIDENPTGVFDNLTGAIAAWTGIKFDFYDPDVLGYNLCTVEEKEICARLYIGLIPQHIQDFGREQTFEWRKEYHALATETRHARMQKAESLVEEDLPHHADYILFHLMSKVRTLKDGEIAQLDLHKLYKDIGIKGSVEERRPVTLKDGRTGIIDWFYARNTRDYDFSAKGLSNEKFQPLSGISLREFCDRIYEILVLGV